MTPKRWTIVSCITGTTALLALATLIGIVVAHNPRMHPAYTVAAAVVVLLGMASIGAYVIGCLVRMDERHADCVGGLVRHADGVERVMTAIRSVVPSKGGNLRQIN